MRDSVNYNQLNAPSLPPPFSKVFYNVRSMSGAHNVLPSIYIHTPLYFLVLHEKNGLPFI